MLKPFTYVFSLSLQEYCIISSAFSMEIQIPSYNVVNKLLEILYLNEMYSEVREHLRRQHAINTKEVHGKDVDNSYKYSYYGYDETQGL